MNCAWRSTWQSYYFFHSWLFWLFLILTITAALIFLLNHLRIKQQMKCPGCNSLVQEVYLRCPDCGQGLKSHCPSCSRIVENSWQFCPHCQEALHHGGSNKPTKAGMGPA